MHSFKCVAYLYLNSYFKYYTLHENTGRLSLSHDLITCTMHDQFCTAY